MDDALPWQQAQRRDQEEPAQQRTGVTARTGGPGDDEPVRIAVVTGPVNIDMAQEALREAGIPVLVKRNSAWTAYGLSVGVLAAAEVWVPRPLAEQAEDVLVGIGVLEN